MSIMNEVFLVEVIIPFTGHSVMKIVVAKDRNEAEEIAKGWFKETPLGDMSEAVITKSEKIDREKKGIVNDDA